MKSVEFSEEQLKDLSKIATELFEDEKDPASKNYIRSFNRPKISFVKVILIAMAALAAIASVFYVVFFFCESVTGGILAALSTILFLIILHMKKLLIFSVKLYQRFAPISIRIKCRYEPSCSEYMILSIEKYGVLKGVCNGIKRLKRCNIDGGGFDYP